MVKKIFLEWKKKDSSPKLLICAPSNGAIDEIGKRLFREKDFLLDSKFKRSLRIVRIGQEDSVNPDVKKNMFIDNLIEKNIKLKLNEFKNFHAGELEDKEAKLNELTMQANDLERNKQFDQLKQVQRQIHTIKSEIGYLARQEEKQQMNKKNTNINTEVQKKKLRLDLLSKADIILSTLSSCCNSSLLKVFNEKQIFNCCIIDEASQCTEPEILMPLSFNSISKMILIGDPMQLPATTISTVACKYGFGTSLFERFYNYLKNKTIFNQFYIMLNIQYRMHSEICALPSRLFYNNLLGTDKKPNSRKFPLIPYKVFDIQDTVECKQNVKNIHNSLESDFVIKLTDICAQILENDNKLKSQYVKIGIITPYQGQRKLIEDKVNKPNNLKVRIEVNTIDGFQGREMDIIIISAVRSFKDQKSFQKIGFLNSYQRLNVAVTRAKCSLFICLNAISLQKNKLWRELIDDAKQRNLYQCCTSNIQTNYLANYITDNSELMEE